MKKSVIIVGGSKGIGRAIREKLRSKYTIHSISRSEDEDSAENVKYYQCDVLNDELPTIEDASALIYCPGSINLKPIGRLSREDFMADYEINVLGAVKCIQKYVEVLKKNENASVLLFSTVAVKLGMPFHASVASAKAAVEGLTKSLGAEFATSVRFNAIAPTVTNTDLASKLLRNEKMIENIKDRHPLKTFLQPNDVANLAAFLVSEEASKITGQIFEMDCGIVSFKL